MRNGPQSSFESNNALLGPNTVINNLDSVKHFYKIFIHKLTVDIHDIYIRSRCPHILCFCISIDIAVDFVFLCIFLYSYHHLQTLIDKLPLTWNRAMRAICWNHFKNH